MSKFDYSMSSLDERAPLFGPTGISPPTHRGLLGPGIGDSQSHRGRKRVGIVCLVLVIFLQGFNINPGKIRFSLAHFLHIENKQFRHDFEGLTVIAAVLLYFLPMVVGLYADTYAGRYKALFLGIGLKLTGSILGFILLLVFEAEHAKGGAGAESVHIMSQSAIKALFAIFIVSNVFTMVGFVVILPSMLSFAAQQLEPTFYGISSFVRW
ncbi:uncharacterized protein LOC135497646 [Lineus longissimus]|uniref:uncharacterized protein LOC135497646 n=1 Tax=Lineus longissimus TaxID=88925 RepID=UPI00315D7576